MQTLQLNALTSGTWRDIVNIGSLVISDVDKTCTLRKPNSTSSSIIISLSVAFNQWARTQSVLHSSKKLKHKDITLLFHNAQHN